MLRIGFDAKQLFNNFTGPGNYSRTLLKNLTDYFPDNAYFLYTDKVVKNEETHFFLNSAFYSVHMPKGQPGLLWRNFGIKREMRKHKLQLFHGLDHELPVGLPHLGVKSVVTIHDLSFLPVSGPLCFLEKAHPDCAYPPRLRASRSYCRH